MLGLFALLGLVAALTPSITSVNVARAPIRGGLPDRADSKPGVPRSGVQQHRVTSYTVAVAHDVDQITIVATPADAGSVAFTQPGLFGPTPIPDADTNTDGHQVDNLRLTIYVEVTETGLTETTYIVSVNRAPAPPASLTALTVSPGSLAPAFSSTVTSYTVALAHDVDQITIVATPAGAGSVAVTQPGFLGTTPIPDADLTTDGHQVDNPPLTIYVEVTGTGLTKTTYTLRLNRAPAPPTSLTALTVSPGSLDPGFSSTVTSYTVALAHDVDQITIVTTPAGAGSVAFAEPADFGTTPIPDADTTADGHQVDIVGTSAVILVVVTETGHSEVSYTVTVNRAESALVARDRAALMALYNSTDGPNWTNNENWGSTLPLDDWYNVNTDADGRVTYLALWDNNLRGTLPAELGNLDQLTELPLQDNYLTGSIPDLGRLTNLTLLRMWNNQLTGRIPASLSNLTRLRYLELWENQLTGPIPDLRSNTGLVFLDLHGNQLSGKIPSMSGLDQLQDMHLNDNLLSGAIPDLSGLTSLERLYLERNQLTGEIPPSLDSLTSLVNLYLHENKLTGAIPPSLGNFADLTQLFLWGNQLTGEIPASLGNLSTLRQLGLSRNQLTGKIPDSLGNLTELLYLYLDNNQLEGPIPDLSRLTNLQVLYLWENRLSGPIPDWLGNLTGLVYLYLNNNQLEGPIPDLSRLTNLQVLYLWGNRLSGPIPDWLGNLTDLRQLSLSRNQLTGGILDLSRLTSLEYLALNDNQLSGAIPDLSRLTELEYLYLWGNQLDGPIPDWLGDLTYLRELYLSSNQLSGAIPDSLSRLTKLEVVRFASNKDADGNPSLTGCVPHGLRYLVAAEQFDPDVPLHDFIAVDANRDGDTDDPDDTPGLNLPFCMVSALTFSDVILVPDFASGTAAYTASVANDVQSTTVTATLNDDGDRLSIMKSAASYTNGASVPLAVGSNRITIEITPSDATPKQTYTVTVTRAPRQVVVSFGPGPYAALEGGPAAKVQVVLDKDSQRTVTIPLIAAPRDRADTGDYAAPAEVVFNAGETTKDVTVTAVNDSVDDDGESVELSFGDLPVGVSEGATTRAVVQITDNDGRGIDLSRTSLAVSEGGSATYTVALASRPTTTVTVTITGHLGTDLSLDRTSLFFTASTWNTAQVVMVSAAQDPDSTNDSATLTHTASGADYGSVTAEVMVTVVDMTVIDGNEPPVVTGTETFTYRENGTAALYTFRATDPERSAITWSVTGTDRYYFAISETGALAFTNPPDYESPADSGSDNVYEVTVVAQDDAFNSGGLDVVVTVTDVNEGPEVAGPPSLSFTENQFTDQILATYTATDPEDTSASITRWSLTGTDAGDFAIDESGRLSFRNVPDHERPADSGRDNVYNLSVRASDGRNYGYLEVTVTVQDVNEPPTITTTSRTSFTYRENGTAALYTFRATDPERSSIEWSVTGPDRDDFTISETGVLAFSSPPDYENPADSGRDNVYEVTVVAQDDASNSGTLDVVVTVTDQNEGPEVAGPPSLSFPENQATDRVLATYTATDP